MKAYIYIDIKYSTLQDQRKFFEDNEGEIFRAFDIFEERNDITEDYAIRNFVYNKDNDAIKIYDEYGNRIIDLENQRKFFNDNEGEIFRAFDIFEERDDISDEFVINNFLYPPNPYGLVKTLKDTTEQSSELVEKLSTEQQSRETNEQLTKLLTDTQRTAIDLVTQLQTEHKNQVVKNTTASVVKEILKSGVESGVESRVKTETITKPQLKGLLGSAETEANAVIKRLLLKEENKKKEEEAARQLTDLLDSARTEANTVIGELQTKSKEKKQIIQNKSKSFVGDLMTTQTKTKPQLTGLLGSAETKANNIIEQLFAEEQKNKTNHILTQSEDLAKQLIEKLEKNQQNQEIIQKFKKLIESKTKEFDDLLPTAAEVKDVVKIAQGLKKEAQLEYKKSNQSFSATDNCSNEDGCIQELSTIVQKYKQDVDKKALGKVDELLEKIGSDQIEKIKTKIQSLLNNSDNTGDKGFLEGVIKLISDTIAKKSDDSGGEEDTLKSFTEENSLIKPYKTKEKPKIVTYKELTTQIQNLVEIKRDSDPSLEDCEKVEQLKKDYAAFQNQKQSPDRQKKDVETAMGRVTEYIQKCEARARKLKKEEISKEADAFRQQRAEKKAAEAAAKAAAEKQKFIQKIDAIIKTPTNDLENPSDALANLTLYINKEQGEIDAFVSENEKLFVQLKELVEKATQMQSTGSEEEKQNISKQIKKLRTEIDTKKNSITKLQTELEKTKQKKKEIGNSLLIVNVGKSIKKIHDSIMTMTRFIDGFKTTDFKNPHGVEGYINKIPLEVLKMANLEQIEEFQRILEKNQNIKTFITKLITETNKSKDHTKNNPELSEELIQLLEKLIVLQKWYDSPKKALDNQLTQIKSTKNHKKTVSGRVARRRQNLEVKSLQELLDKTTVTATYIIKRLNQQEQERLIEEQAQQEQAQKQLEEEQQKQEQARKQRLKKKFDEKMEPFKEIKDSVEFITGGSSDPSIEDVMKHIQKYGFDKKENTPPLPKWGKILSYAFRLTDLNDMFDDIQNDANIMADLKKYYNYLFGDNNLFDNNKINKKPLIDYLTNNTLEIYEKTKKLTFYEYKTQSKVGNRYIEFTQKVAFKIDILEDSTYFNSSNHIISKYKTLFICIVYYCGCRMLDYYINQLKKKNKNSNNTTKEKIHDLVLHLDSLNKLFKENTELYITTSSGSQTASTQKEYLDNIIQCINEIINIKKIEYSDLNDE